MIEPIALLIRRHRRGALTALAASAGLIALTHSPVAVAGAARADDDTRYVLVASGSNSSTMSGSVDDIQRAMRLRVGREALLYVRRGGVAYVIRDAATLRRAEAIFEPQRAMGERQAELGSRQAELGSRQAALGAQQARIGARQARTTPKNAEALGRQQDALGRQQNALGRQQDELGRQQDALGREQERLSRIAESRLRELLDDAIQGGVARRVD